MQKRTIPQVAYKRSKKVPYSTKEIQQHIQYHEKEEGVVTTLILCNPERANRLNCQHYFIDEDLQYSFNHSDRDLKNWRKLQTALVPKVKSWEL